MSETNIANGVEREICSITETLAATGLAPTPAPAREDHALYGGANADRAAVETVAAIERACEAAIAEFSRAADNAEAIAREVRAEADAFAEQLRAYTRGFGGHLGDFLAFCQQARNMSRQHSADFEDKLATLAAPRGREAA